MKPLALQLQNFGPFIDEKVDFERLTQAPLFLISGKTGAGKTTIFDGMTYALFGETSGSVRSGKEMRSTFATPTEETSVTFLFEHQGLEYEINRKPEQLLAKKKGSGERKQTAKVSLRIFDGAGQEMQQYSKRSEVDQLIHELLHLNARQFSQIVLLPQGEFRTFLNANSKEKELVLRNLFGTQMYQQVTDNLKLLFKEKQQALEKISEEISFYQQQVSEVDPVINTQEWLQVVEAQQEEQVMAYQQAEAVLAQRKKESQQAEKAYREAEKLAEHFKEYGELQVTQKALEIETATLVPKKVRLAELKWAQAQQPLLDKITGVATELTKLEAKQATLLTEQQILEEQFQQWEQGQTEHQEMLATLEEQKQQQNQLQQLLPLVNEFRELKQQAHNNQQRIVEETDLLAAGEAQVVKLVAEMDQLTTKLQEKATWEQRQSRLQDAERKLEKLTDLEKNYQKQQQLKKENQQLISNLEINRQQLTKELETKRRAFRELKSQWAQLQIARLRLDLLPGEACPVCGSTEHPQVDHQQTVIQPERITAMEVEVAQAEEDLGNFQAEVVRVEEQLNQQINQQKELEEEGQLLGEALEQQLKLPVDGFLEVNRVADFKQQVKDFQQQQREQATILKELAIGLEERQGEYQRVVNQVNVSKERLHQIQGEQQNVNGQLQRLDQQFQQQDAEEIATKNQLISQKINELNQAVADYQTAGQHLQTAKATNAEKQKIFATEFQEKTEIHHQLKQELTTILDEHQTNRDQLESLVAASEEINPLAEQIQAFEKRLALHQERLTLVKEKIANQKAPNVQEASARYQRLETEKNQLQETSFTLKQEAANVEKNYQQVQKLYQTSQKQFDELSELQQLSQTMSGDNPRKLSIERYVLQTYLQEVLKVANVRLQRLTKGRYQFELATGIGSYRSQTGLEINIFDDSAGCSRSAHTLSGGESFIAALALALSLAEVIQNQAGGIAIEALFIDEGFGSLDEESLEMAMEALETIEAEGRMIGIISHVRELKERIYQQVHVRTFGNGQSQIEYLELGGE